MASSGSRADVAQGAAAWQQGRARHQQPEIKKLPLVDESYALPLSRLRANALAPCVAGSRPLPRRFLSFSKGSWSVEHRAARVPEAGSFCLIFIHHFPRHPFPSSPSSGRLNIELHGYPKLEASVLSSFITSPVTLFLPPPQISGRLNIELHEYPKLEASVLSSFITSPVTLFLPPPQISGRLNIELHGYPKLEASVLSSFITSPVTLFLPPPQISGRLNIELHGYPKLEASVLSSFITSPVTLFLPPPQISGRLNIELHGYPKLEASVLSSFITSPVTLFLPPPQISGRLNIELHGGRLNIELHGYPKLNVYFVDLFHTLVNMPLKRFSVVLVAAYAALFVTFAIPFLAFVSFLPSPFPSHTSLALIALFLHFPSLFMVPYAALFVTFAIPFLAFVSRFIRLPTVSSFLASFAL
ncbi:unnamed protein product [Closterium sp. Yama58-4]|nr:unnamed protein product [Closterium sp. Yama58-4]